MIVKIRYIVILLIGLTISSCNYIDNIFSDMDDTHKEYIEERETIYLSKPVDVKSYAGEGRLKLSWTIINGYREKSIIGYYNNGADSFQVATPTLSDTTKMEYILDGLDEGDYAFNLYCKDEKANRSIKSIVYGAVFGNRYRLQIQPRAIKNTSLDINSSLHIEWLSYGSGAILSEIRYFNRLGENLTINVPITENRTSIVEIDSDKEIMTRTAFLPQPAAIDTFYTEWTTVDLTASRSR
ncbi:DUF4998 domain-containing protein [Sunxiuqinia rutila]|uniref:DUF4998 domain-containing protein n=1 Tax=Sunxiuqinia rutila TaxID=1397841 RepID=UPI003D368221